MLHWLLTHCAVFKERLRSARVPSSLGEAGFRAPSHEAAARSRAYEVSMPIQAVSEVRTSRGTAGEPCSTARQTLPAGLATRNLRGKLFWSDLTTLTATAARTVHCILPWLLSQPERSSCAVRMFARCAARVRPAWIGSAMAQPGLVGCSARTLGCCLVGPASPGHHRSYRGGVTGT
jgi:hypothetical protein